MAVISAYAPHSGRPYDERQNFYAELERAFQRTSVNGSRIVFGDLNARLHRRLPSEEDIFGDYVFETRSRMELGSNRELLVELCTSFALAAANTFIDLPPEELVTYRNLGVAPLTQVTADRFGQLDWLLVPQQDLHRVRDIRSYRAEPLASQHFLVIANFDTALPRRVQVVRNRPRDRDALKDPEVAQQFRNIFIDALPSRGASLEDVDTLSSHITNALRAAEESAIPEMRAVPCRPWIRQTTLGLINERRLARAACDYAEEARLHKAVRKEACMPGPRRMADRAGWPRDLGSNSAAARSEKRGGATR